MTEEKNMDNLDAPTDDPQAAIDTQDTVRTAQIWFPPGVTHYLGMGTRCFVGMLDNGNVLKYAKFPSEPCPELAVEEKIYAALGQHPYILTCLGWNGYGLQFPLRTDISQSIQNASMIQRRIWVRQCAVAVAHVHDRGVMHCDIHPNNVLLDKDNNVQLSDFQGVYKSADGGAMEATRYSMPQDWEIDSKPSMKRDIFALGGLMYWIMTGLHPHQSVADDGVERLFKEGQLPSTEIEFGKQIAKCWRQEYDYARETVSDLENDELTAS